MKNQNETIDHVIYQLEEIIDWSRKTKSRIGYFTALYHKVTVKVKEAIKDNFFDDRERMEHLDVIFANRYLDAVKSYRKNEQPTGAWTYSFNVSKQRWPIVLQHLLLGMNAHINLDLGIAAARTVSSNELPGLHGDFNRINKILSALVTDVNKDLIQIWPILGIFSSYLGNTKTSIINFSMEKARDKAWSIAERLAPLDEIKQKVEIEKLDTEVTEFANVILHPGFMGSLVCKIIRLGELGSIPKKIEILR